MNPIPPKLMRFLAWQQHQRRPLTNDEIAEASGLARSTVAKLSTFNSWDSVRWGTIKAFAKGCRVDLRTGPGVLREMFRRRVAAIGRAKVEQRKMLARLLREL